MGEGEFGRVQQATGFNPQSARSRGLPRLRWRILVLLIPLIHLIGGPCFAGVTVSGMAPARYEFGAPVAGSFANYIEFWPLSYIEFQGDPLYDPFYQTEVIELGRLVFGNGRTTGTGSSAIAQLNTSGVALIDHIIPNAVVPVKAWFTIPVIITPNLTGDPWQDADYWSFPGIGVVSIPEGGTGWVKAYGQLFGVNVASPPEYYTMELTGLEAGGGSALVIPTVPAPSALLLVCLGGGLFRAFRRRFA